MGLSVLKCTYHAMSLYSIEGYVAVEMGQGGVWRICLCVELKGISKP